VTEAASGTGAAGRYAATWRLAGPSGSTWAVLGLLAAVLYLVCAPLAGIVLGSVTDSPPGEAPSFTLATLAEAYGDADHLRSLVNSLVFAALTASLVLVIGGALAWAAARTDAAIRHFVDLFALAPMLIPSVLFVAGWVLLLGPKNGLVNLLLVDYLGLAAPPFDIYSFAGMVWVATLQEIPLAFLWLWPAFRSLNPELEEAALMAGAGAGRVLRRISLPLLRPALLSAWVIFFVYALGALMVPLMIGLPARIVLYPTEIYLASQRVPSDLNLASAYSLVLLATSALGVFAYRRATREGGRFVTVTGKSFRPHLTRLGVWRLPVTLFAATILLLAAGLPILVLAWNAFLPYPQAPSAQSLKLLTLANFANALAYGPAVSALVNSLWLGFAAGLAATLLGSLVAWCTLRLRRPAFLIAVLDQLATAPIAAPGLTVGVSLLWVYLFLPLPIYGTPWLFLIAYVTLHLPYAVRICASGLAQLHLELEEAGRVAGASWPFVFRRIIFRLMGPSLLASLLYVALRSFREYAASIFLAVPGSQVFSVLVLDMWDTGNFGMLSAYVTMAIVVLAVIVGAFSWLMRRAGTRLAGDA
jgi:iron(III) transport system permease protein